MSVDSVNNTVSLQFHSQESADEQLLATLDSIGYGFFACDSEWRFVHVNATAEQLLGINRQEVLGKSHWDVFPQTLASRLEEEYRRAAAGETRVFDNFFESRSRWFHNRCFPRKGGGISVYFQDITEHKETEQVLREQEQRLSFYVDHSPMAIVEWDAGFIVTRWSGEAERIFGWSAAETIGKPIMDLHMIYDEDIPLVEQTMSRLTERFARYVVSANRNVTRDGRVIHCEWYNTILTDPQGEMVSVLSQVLDITDRKQAEEQNHALIASVQEEKEKLLALVNSIADEVWFLDTEQKLSLINQTAATYFGLDSAATIDIAHLLSTLEVLRPDGSKRPLDESPSLCALKGEVCKNSEHIIRSPVTGELRHRQVNSAPVRDTQGRIIGSVAVTRDITELKRREEELRKAVAEINRLKELLEAENIYLRDEIDVKEGYGDIIGRSDPLRYVIYRIQQVARTRTTVLLTGETGTGKGIFARFLHRESDRRDKPFVNVNCAGLPPNLIESELFGREKGAFTGSVTRQIGRFELANGGTIFLDEIGELPLELQAKLLKVVEEGEFERLGSPYPVKVDVRIVASTNRNLEEEIKAGRFRQDLFFRLGVFPVTIPPLRQRKEDIPLLVEAYTTKFTRYHHKAITRIPHKTMDLLKEYSWPGNVRELINVIERAVIVSDGPELRLAEQLWAMQADSVREKSVPAPGLRESKALAEAEREHILRTLQETGWRIEGQRGAAGLLEMHPNTLRARMKKLGIRRPGA